MPVSLSGDYSKPTAFPRQHEPKRRLLGARSLPSGCNAVVESFFDSFKQERVQWRNYQTRYQAQQDILEYISMFYNIKRLHSYLDYMCPNDYERQLMAQKKKRLNWRTKILDHLNHKWWGKFGHNLTVYTHSEYFGLSEKDGGRKTKNCIKYNFQSIRVAVIVFVH